MSKPLLELRLLDIKGVKVDGIDFEDDALQEVGRFETRARVI